MLASEKPTTKSNKPKRVVVGLSKKTFQQPSLFKSHENTIGRNKPAAIPAKLARTSAFAPKSRNLSTDSEFHKLYVVDNESIIEVQGREIGVPHRDLCVAIFRDPPTEVQIPNEQYNPRPEPGTGQYLDERITLPVCEAQLTWRQLLLARNLSPQHNNKKTILKLMQDMQKVIIVSHEGDPKEVIRKFEEGKISEYGKSENILQSIRWKGTGLDDYVYIRYGGWVREMFLSKKLVSLNADVQFALKTAYGKSVWPYIDSRPDFNWIDESRICQLLGIDIWADGRDYVYRKRHREKIRDMFDDMVAAGGIMPRWTEKPTGNGKNKGRRYFYAHKLAASKQLRNS